jgi:ATPase subunit of ABC transporter with duplicated ATPase domains
MAAGSKKGRSERTQSTLLIKENRMMKDAENKLQSAKDNIEIKAVINVDLPKTHVPNGKMIIEINHLGFAYQGLNHKLIDNLSLKIIGPLRIAINGCNGSGKSTLMKLILGTLIPSNGQIHHGTPYIAYVDQHASLLNPHESILENFLRLNPDATCNHAYRCLAQFLFKNTAAEKLISELSGGQKIRALLACTLMAKHPPQLLMLDEPTNHLDIDSIKSIESALKAFQGAMLVISHDQAFLDSIGISKIISL